MGDAETTWIEVALRFAAEESHAAIGELGTVLSAFAAPWPRGGPAAPPERRFSGDLVALEREHVADDAIARIAGVLVEEIDRGQAELFARRTRAVDELLAALATREAQGDRHARVLRVGLRQRLAGVLAAAGPRAPRVRALADFYYSHACRHVHRLSGGDRLPPLAAAIAALRWRELAPGLAHATLDGAFAEGPTHVSLLRVDPRLQPLDVVDCRADAEAGVPFVQTVARHGARAATSGGFFLYSEADIAPPSRRHDAVGLLVRGGEVVSAPWLRRGALVIDRDGAAAIERIGVERLAASIHGQRLDVTRAVNRASASHGPDEPSVALVGDRVVAVGRALAVPLNGAVIPCDAALAVGDRLELVLDDAAIVTAIAGGPVLLERGRAVHELRREDFWGTAPPVTFSQDETGDANLLPRLAVGTIGSELLFAAIDGRNLERALGMTLGDVATMMAALGCTDALNLDGGSSKRMVLDGETLDLPSTDMVGVGAAIDPGLRPVYTAVLIGAAR